MKKRNGFVSNSSSSSFLVLKPSDKEVTKESVKDFLINSFGYDADDLEECLDRYYERIKKWLGDKTGELVGLEVEYGGEDSILKMAKILDASIIDMDNL